MTIGALATLSWHAVTVALIDANGCEVRLVATLDARLLAIDTVVKSFALASGDSWILADHEAFMIVLAEEDAVAPAFVPERKRSGSVTFYADTPEQ
jgi:hypothetical protein